MRRELRQRLERSIPTSHSLIHALRIQRPLTLRILRKHRQLVTNQRDNTRDLRRIKRNIISSRGSGLGLRVGVHSGNYITRLVAVNPPHENSSPTDKLT